MSTCSHVSPCKDCGMRLCPTGRYSSLQSCSWSILSHCHNFPTIVNYGIWYDGDVAAIHRLGWVLLLFQG
jgi:hypothetical protein